ncbi:MAG: hypothetical protein KGH68_02200 [Patescibacteria group bacterium]|nr:hypothetical protein [Patescibacteria group bacterium]
MTFTKVACMCMRLMRNKKLTNILKAPETEKKIFDLSSYFSDLVKLATEELNSNFAVRQLSKLPRSIELLPTDPRQLSSYRTRIGTMLEYAMCTSINKILEKRYGDELFLTFVSAHQYPDFHLRNKKREILARIEMKAIDAESDEQAARFDVSTHLINPEKDLLLIIGWSWQDITGKKGEKIAESPRIFASLVIPAGELAKERDERLKITGGKIEKGEVFVYSKKSNKFVPDPGNYGKFWRIIHRSRLTQAKPSSTVTAFMAFLEQVDKLAPRKRFNIEKVEDDADEEVIG